MSALAAWLGPGARHEGALTLSGPTRLEGELRGALICDDFVEIGATAVVHGDVEAPQVLVEGTVLGAVRARERVTVAPTGRVEGRVVTPWLDVRLGARLRGEVAVDRPA